MASLTLLLNISSSLARIEEEMLSKLGSEHLRCSPNDVVDALVLFRNVFLDRHSDYSDKKGKGATSQRLKLPEFIPVLVVPHFSSGIVE